MFQSNPDAARDAAHARALGITDAQFAEFSRRAAKFIGPNPTPARFRACFFILQEIIERDKAATAATLRGTGKNPVLAKYGTEIVDFWRSGLGSRAIASHLQKAHGRDAKIGKSTIDRFLAANGLQRGQDG